MVLRRGDVETLMCGASHVVKIFRVASLSRRVTAAFRRGRGAGLFARRADGPEDEPGVRLRMRVVSRKT